MCLKYGIQIYWQLNFLFTVILLFLTNWYAGAHPIAINYIFLTFFISLLAQIKLFKGNQEALALKSVLRMVDHIDLIDSVSEGVKWEYWKYIVVFCLSEACSSWVILCDPEESLISLFLQYSLEFVKTSNTSCCHAKYCHQLFKPIPLQIICRVVVFQIFLAIGCYLCFYDILRNVPTEPEMDRSWVSVFIEKIQKYFAQIPENPLTEIKMSTVNIIILNFLIISEINVTWNAMWLPICHEKKTTVWSILSTQK